MFKLCFFFFFEVDIFRTIHSFQGMDIWGKKKPHNFHRDLGLLFSRKAKNCYINRIYLLLVGKQHNLPWGIYYIDIQLKISFCEYQRTSDSSSSALFKQKNSLQLSTQTARWIAGTFYTCCYSSMFSSILAAGGCNC